jgi:hypothetical protein
MKDNDKLVALIRLRDMLYFGVRPTFRQCGFPAEIVQELAKEGLIQLGDRRHGDDLDRYVIEEILPAGHSFISQQHALPSLQTQAPADRPHRVKTACRNCARLAATQLRFIARWFGRVRPPN